MSETESSEAPKYTPKPGGTGADPMATHLTRELQHDRGLLSCRIDPSGRYVFAGALDYFVHRWDLHDTADLEAKAALDPKAKPDPKKETPPGKREILSGHESWVRAMDLFPNGKDLVTGDYVGGLIAWPEAATAEKAASVTPRFSIAAHEGSIRAVSVSPDGSRIASAGNDGMVRIWSAIDGKRIRELAGHDCHVYHTAFHPKAENTLISADLKGIVKHWDTSTGQVVREIDASPLHTYSEKYSVDVGGIRGMSFNTDGSRLLCSGAAGEEKGIAHSGNARVLLFDWETGKLLEALRAEKEEISTAWAVRFHPDGFIIASGGSRTGGFLWFWMPDDEICFHQVKFRQRAPGFDFDNSPDGKSLAVANHDGALRLWKMEPEPEPQSG